MPEQDQLVAQIPGAIETGRWYDIQIVLQGSHLECYLDGQRGARARICLSGGCRGFSSSAVREDRSQEIILKVVNPGAADTTAEIQLAGVNVGSEVKALVLTGADPGGVNALEDPRRLAPAESKLRLDGSRVSHRFPRYSFTVWRIPTR